MTVPGKGGRPKRERPRTSISLRLEPDTVMDVDRIGALKGWGRHKTIVALIELGVATHEVAVAELAAIVSGGGS